LSRRPEEGLDFYRRPRFQKKTDIDLGGLVATVACRPMRRMARSSSSSLRPSRGRRTIQATPWSSDGIPATSFAVDDVQAESDRLRSKGVRFTQEPTQMGAVTTAVFDDTCGNLIQIVQLA
jgi:hypothetical protein